MIDVKRLFENASGLDSFTRIDKDHPLDIYVGKDSSFRHTMFVISSQKPNSLKSSLLIDVYIGLRSDGRFGLSFSLKDTTFFDLFCHFCDDIISSSKFILLPEKGVEFICSRYEKWQTMLKKDTSTLLSKSEIKGIIGEMYFLKNYMIPTYGEDMAINSWMGPQLLPQDFMCEEKWYEIKSISSNRDTLTITSLEQLDSNIVGELVVIYLDSTSVTTLSKITINELYHELKRGIHSEKLCCKFTDILLLLGYYPREEYDEYAFKFSKCARYMIDMKFPCIRKSDIPQSIIAAKYELSLLSISNFLLEVDDKWK